MRDAIARRRELTREDIILGNGIAALKELMRDQRQTAKF